MDTTVLPNPVIKDDPELAELERMAQEVDAQAFAETESTDAQQPDPASPADEEKETTPQGDKTPDNLETKPEVVERKRDAQGRFLKQDGTLDPDQAESVLTQPGTKTDAKSETPFAKAQKEADRRDRSWKALETEKAQARAEAAARERVLAQREAEIERQRNAPRISPDGRNGYTAEQYVQAAKEYRAQYKAHLQAGNYAEAEKLDDLAEKAQVAANEAWQYETQVSQHQQREAFAAKYQANLKAEFEKDPELQNPEAPIHKYLGPLMQGEPYFGQTEDGFSKAKQVAKWQMDSELVSGLRDKLTKAEAEIARLNKATQPSSSGPVAPSTPRKLDDMPVDEALRELQRMAEQHDSVPA